MGQTLTHGVYLPDEGERNCYNGLAANWSILDGAVGTIAEHTTQIAGKAPAVHTHVKSDVTDLLNSNFIPSANNSYDLGSSSYQWNNVYSKNYFYNGVAWGLDKENVWSANNSFYGMTIYGSTTNTFQSNSSAGEKGDASVFALNIQVQDKNHAGWSSSGVANIGLGQDSNGSYISFALDTKDSNNTRRNNALSFLLRPTDNSHNAYFFPNRDNTVDLGTSTNKWKTLNGINPGALSLPSNSYTGSIAITEIDRTGWVYDGTVNTYSPPVDCWLSISNGGIMTVWDTNTAFGMHATDNIAIPLRQGETYTISLTHTPDFCRIYPCNGNV